MIRTERICLLNGRCRECAFISTATRGRDQGDGFGPLVLLLRGEAIRWPSGIARQADFAHEYFA